LVTALLFNYSYYLSLHDALPIYLDDLDVKFEGKIHDIATPTYSYENIYVEGTFADKALAIEGTVDDKNIQLTYNSSIDWKNNTRSEEHTSELQSRENLVCRLLLG